MRETFIFAGADKVWYLPIIMCIYEKLQVQIAGADKVLYQPVILCTENMKNVMAVHTTEYNAELVSTF